MSKWRKEFPALRRGVVYLDSAATTLKPKSVIAAEQKFLENSGVSVHRGLYPLAEEATAAYEATRSAVAAFIGCRDPREVIFTRNATEALNVLASGIVRTLKPNDAVAVSELEHHSNFVPWQQAAQQHSNTFAVLPIDEQGTVDLKTINKRTAVLSISALSNVFGTEQPIAKIIRQVRAKNSKMIIVLDVAQAIAHIPIDVAKLNVDAVVFSMHKLYGPTGVGVLWARRDLLEKIPPFEFGGEMVDRVAPAKTTFAALPAKFEAGTPNVAGVIASGAAIAFVQKVGYSAIAHHTTTLTRYAIEQLAMHFGAAVQIIGALNPGTRHGVLAFTYRNYHPHDIAQILGNHGVCIRAGHHCAQPLHDRLGISASCRISLGIYNTKEDIDRFIAALKNVDQVLG